MRKHRLSEIIARPHRLRLEECPKCGARMSGATIFRDWDNTPGGEPGHGAPVMIFGCPGCGKLWEALDP